MTEVEAAPGGRTGSAFQESLLEALVEASLDGILVVSPAGRILSFNRRFVEMWGISDAVVATGSDAAAIESVSSSLVDPDGFRARIEYLYEHPEERSLDEIRLRDGRIFDRFSAPISGADGEPHGRVWFFRDVTDERHHALELHARLVQLESISRVAQAVDRGESLDDVYGVALDELLAATAATRASVLMFDDAGVMRFSAWRGLSDAYRAAVEGHTPWRPDERDPVPITVADVTTDPALRELAPIIVAEGIRSLAFVPLLHQGALVGNFMLYHDEIHEFSEPELRLAQTIGSQVAAATERRRTADALRNSRDQLDAILRQVADGITVQDESARIVYANDAAARLLGFASAADFVATPVEELVERFELFDEDGRPLPLDALPGRRAIREGVSCEALIRHRDRRTGIEGWAIVRATPVRDDDGSVRFAVNAFHDVTARRRAGERIRLLAQAAELLAASRDYGRTLTEVARLAVPSFADWCIVYLKQPDGSIRRLAVEHAPGEPAGFLAGLDRHRLRVDSESGVPAVIASGQPLLAREASAADLAADVEDPEALAAELAQLDLRSWICVPLVAASGVLGAISFIGRSERRAYDEDDLALATEVADRAAVAIENAILVRELDERAQAAEALAFTADGVCLIDCDGVVRLWNAAAAAITSLAEAEVVGRRLTELIPSWQRVDDAVGDSAGPVSVPVDVRGSELWLSVSASRFDRGAVYAFRDLTQERALERLKADFISTVSHELRTPLAAIYGASMTLRRPDMGDDAEREQELLGIISSEAERLARTVNDVLWASRLETGTLPVAIESCDAGELATTVVAAARTHLSPILRIDLDIADELPPVAADPDKVRQVLANLLDNAVKYSPDGGTITVAVERAERYVRFVVRDEGLGIPPSERERVFEKFYRLDPNLTRGVGGTGLGLYICRELVRRMDGRIAITSPDATGTTVAVELPVAG